MPFNFNNLDNKSKAILFGLFLSKYDREALRDLGIKTYTAAINRVGDALGVSPNSILIHRNKFDPFFPNNNRKGFRFLKEAGLLREYEEYIKKTLEWSKEDFLELFKPIFDVRGENGINWRLTIKYERLSKAFDRTFERMLKNANKNIGEKLSSLEDHQDNEKSDDETTNIDEDLSQYIKALLSGFDTTFEQNIDHFEKYISAARRLLVFMREYWNEEHLIPSHGDDLSHYYWHWYWYNSLLDDVIEDLQHSQSNVLNMIYTYSSVDHARNAFALFYVQGELYDLQRALVDRACNALGSIISHRYWLLFRYDHVHHILRAQDRDAFINLMVSPKPSQFLPLKRNIVTGNDLELINGSLFAEFAYYLFESHKRTVRSANIMRHQLTIRSQSNQFLIDGDFELPCNLKGYLAQSDNGVIILGFRGTKPTHLKNDISDFWQILIGPETSYLCALGLLLELRDSIEPEKCINVYGHSLGGGLSQFAVAVATAKGQNNINAYGYNSAGLGRGTMSIILELTPIKNTNISHLCHKSDRISKIGYLLGDCYLIGKKTLIDRINPLPKHGIKTLITTLGLTKGLIADLIRK